MLIRRQTTNLLQIFCEISLHSQVIFKSMKVADDISRGTLECEWVKIYTAMKQNPQSKARHQTVSLYNHLQQVFQYFYS